MIVKIIVLFITLIFTTETAKTQVIPVGFWANRADPHFSSVVLLIQPDPSASTVTDYSGSGHTISLGGDATLSSDITDPWGGSRKSIKFDGTGDYASAPDSADWNNGSSDFTFEVWVYFSYIDTNTRYGLIQQRFSSSYFTVFNVNNLGNQGLDFYVVDSSPIIDGGGVVDTTATSSNWHHIALVRSGNTFTLYLNGTSESSVVDSSSWPDIASPLYLGGNPITGTYLDGYFGAIRITKGVARYTSDFTVPALSFPIR